MRWPPVVIRGTSPRPTRTLPRATRTPPSADPKRRSKTTAPRGGGPSAPSNEAALGGGRIDEHPVGAGARAGVELVRALAEKARAKGRRRHVIGIPAESGHPPGPVGRAGHGIAPPAEVRLVRVGDGDSGKGTRQRGSAEMGIPARARESAHVDEDRGLELREQGEQLRERARRMADGPYPGWRAHAAGTRR